MSTFLKLVACIVENIYNFTLEKLQIMKKSILSFKFLLLFVLITGFMSCDKENVTTDDESITEDFTTEDIDMGELAENIAALNIDIDTLENPDEFFQKKRCFEPIFPVTVEFPDGTTQEIANKDAMIALRQEWRENHSIGDGHPTIVFPFQATLANGETVTFNNKEELKNAVKNCIVKRPHWKLFKRCFKPVFPITMIFPDGSIHEMNNKQEVKETFIAWRELNPDVEGRPEFQYPFDITLKNGNVRTINDKHELRRLIFKCLKHKKWFRKCFKVVFPISLEMPDGTILTADSKAQMKSLILEWRDNNPDAAGRPHLVFPFEIELKNGNVVTINNKMDIVKWVRKCIRKKGGGCCGN